MEHGERKLGSDRHRETGVVIHRRERPRYPDRGNHANQQLIAPAPVNAVFDNLRALRMFQA
jgi:hypothetical protein